MFMVKRFYGVAALFLALISYTSSFATQMEDETYSDKKPQSKLIFSIEPEKSKGWDYEKDNAKKILVNGKIVSLFIDAEFSLMPGGFQLPQNSTGFLFVNQSEFLFINTQYKADTLDLSLGLTEENSKIYNMSWPCISKALQKRESCFPQQKKEQDILKRIRKEKIIESIHRIGVTANAQHHYA